MRLDRNETTDGTGKYALINLRKLRKLNGDMVELANALKVLEQASVIEYGNVGEREMSSS